jgi:hypothetical protein
MSVRPVFATGLVIAAKHLALNGDGSDEKADRRLLMSALRHLVYCSSVNFFIQSTTFPFNAS